MGARVVWCERIGGWGTGRIACATEGKDAGPAKTTGTQTARRKAAVQRQARQRRRPEASGTKTENTAGEKNSVAGCAEYFRLLLCAAWGTGRNACATGRQMRGASQRSRPEASGTEAAGTSKAPARRPSYVRTSRRYVNPCDLNTRTVWLLRVRRWLGHRRRSGGTTPFFCEL